MTLEYAHTLHPLGIPSESGFLWTENAGNLITELTPL